MKIRIALIFFCTLIFFYQAGFCGSGSQTSITFSRDTVLNASIEVPENATCVIKPGVVLRFSGYFRFVVNGLLIAEGTRQKPILISGVGRKHGSTEKPCWQGLEIKGKKADAVLRHCRIEGAYRNFIYGTKPSINSCEFVGNHCALYCSNKSAAHIKNNKIYRNKYGIVADYASPMILDNVVTGNVVGVLMMRSSRLIAGRNVVSGNKKDIYSEKSFGVNHDAISLKYIWDLMNQLY